jgi:hypothetical protein
MHIKVPTYDFIRMLSTIKPLRTVVTTGFSFAVYTLEAYDNKLRLVVGDKSTLTASTEIFAEVKQPGKVSVNGTDFLQVMSKIVPDVDQGRGSKTLTMKSTDTNLGITTVTKYEGSKGITQRRSFTLLRSHLKSREDYVPDGIAFEIPAEYLSDIFKVVVRMVSTYTSDIAGLSGVLLRIKSGIIKFVVSDGKRLLEIELPKKASAPDVDILLPKLTCSLLQTLIEDGDSLKVTYDGQRMVRFDIDSNGLKTIVVSSVIVAYFPPYQFFNETGPAFRIKTQLLLDNIINIKKALDDEAFRVQIVCDSETLSITNEHAPDSHTRFTNSGIPLVQSGGADSTVNLLINAFLLESVLHLIGTEDIVVTVPEGKAVIVTSVGSDLIVKAAVARAKPD